MDLQIREIFNSRDLPGEFLVAPVKAYHQFFAEKIRANSGVAKVALIIANIITGIFAYSILGIFALIGMLIKPAGIAALRKHNESEAKFLKDEFGALEIEEARFCVQNRSSMGGERYVLKEFKATKANARIAYLAAAASVVAYGRQLRKVHVTTEGEINIRNKTGEITIRLMSDFPTSDEA